MSPISVLCLSTGRGRTPLNVVEYDSSSIASVRLCTDVGSDGVVHSFLYKVSQVEGYVQSSQVTPHQTSPFNMDLASCFSVTKVTILKSFPYSEEQKYYQNVLMLYGTA